MWARVAVVLLAFNAGAAMAATETFRATLRGASEVPPHQVAGTGVALVQVDPATRATFYEVRFGGLSGPATMAHIHGPAAPGANAGVLVVLGAANPGSPVRGRATLTADQLADLEAGRTYVNVHTAANPTGEIRGQLEKVP